MCSIQILKTQTLLFTIYIDVNIWNWYLFSSNRDCDNSFQTVLRTMRKGMTLDSETECLLED